MLDWSILIPSVLSGGTVAYLVVDKLFSRKKDNAEAHGAEVASFNTEITTIRQIKLDMLEDIRKEREEAQVELQKSKASISGEVSSLKDQVVSLQEVVSNMVKAQSNSDELHAKQLLQLSKTIQVQSEHINKIAMYWRYLCDRDCDERHMPVCPLISAETK